MNSIFSLRISPRILTAFALFLIALGCYFLSTTSFISYLLEHNRYLNVVGIGAILAIAYGSSVNRAAVNSRMVFSALALHFLFALLVLKTPTEPCIS